MSFPSFRTAVAVATFSTLLGFSALQANAQPREIQAPAQVETDNLERLWQWLTELLAPAGGLQKMQSVWSESSTNHVTTPTDANRGMTIDPNG